MPQDRRVGLNCTLSYPWNNANEPCQVRVSQLSHGINITAAESSTRIRKVFYPHHLSISNFAIMVDLNGEDEYDTFINWLSTYIDRALGVGTESYSDFPEMTVDIPARNFNRKGIPIAGYDWGDTAGRYIWRMPITFQGVEDDNQSTSFDYSLVDPGSINKENVFYYPQYDELSSTGIGGSDSAPIGQNVSVTSVGQAIQGDQSIKTKAIIAQASQSSQQARTDKETQIYEDDQKNGKTPPSFANQQTPDSSAADGAAQTGINDLINSGS